MAHPQAHPIHTALRAGLRRRVGQICPRRTLGAHLRSDGGGAGMPDGARRAGGL